MIFLSPMFILPVQRDDGHFIVVGQFKGQTTLITHLEDYKRSAEAAEPYLAITVHDELIETKDIALVRGDFEPAKLRKVPDLNNPRSCAACLKIAWPASLVNFYTSDPARAWALRRALSAGGGGAAAQGRGPRLLRHRRVQAPRGPQRPPRRLRLGGLRPRPARPPCGPCLVAHTHVPAAVRPPRLRPRWLGPDRFRAAVGHRETARSVF